RHRPAAAESDPAGPTPAKMRLDAPGQGRELKGWSPQPDVPMAHYFKFKSVADIEAESDRLHLDLRFSDDLAPLFRPVAIGPLTVGNSLCVQPMEGCDCTPGGAPDELTVRRYRRFGAGGAKLIWGEAAAVTEEGRANPRQLWINDANLPAIAAMLDACRAAHRDAYGGDGD